MIKPVVRKRNFSGAERQKESTGQHRGGSRFKDSNNCVSHSYVTLTRQTGERHNNDGRIKAFDQKQNINNAETKQ